MNLEDQIKKRVTQHLHPHLLEVLDESAMHGSSNSHYRLLVVSDLFVDMSSIQRHRKVYEAIGQDILGQIHAFSQQTYTIEEWNQSGIQTSSPPCHRKSDPSKTS